MEDLQDTFIVHTIEEIQVCCSPVPPPLPHGPHSSSHTPQDCPVGRGQRASIPKIL